MIPLSSYDVIVTYKNMNILFVFISILFCSNKVCSKCEWKINRDLPSNDPVYLKRSGTNYKLYVPKSPYIELAYNESLILACPGNKNYITGTRTHITTVTCFSNTNVFVDKELRNLKDLACTNMTTGDIRDIKYVSRNIRDLIVSFDVSTGVIQPNLVSELFRINYDFDKNTPVYTHHIVYGKALSPLNINHSSFKTNGLSKNITWNKLFTKENQQKILTRLLGEQQAHKYMNKTFLARGHLTPTADFVFPAWSRTTFLYANVVPQWQSINGGGWKNVENIIRTVAQTRQENLKVYTGQQGIMEFEDPNNNDVKLSLDANGGVPVPKYIWKIVCRENSECISFVVLNNPFTNTREHICENICKNTGWYRAAFETSGRDLIVCCEVNELKRKFNNIPNIQATGIFTNFTPKTRVTVGKHKRRMRSTRAPDTHKKRKMPRTRVAITPNK